MSTSSSSSPSPPEGVRLRRRSSESTGECGDDSTYFSIMKHPKEALDMMNSLRHAGQLCDITLRAGREAYTAHRVVLAASSPYFKAMFCTSGMRECQTNEISLQGVQPVILSALIEFAYTSEIHVTEQNVCKILQAATMYQMHHVVDACSTFLEHQLDPSNCIGIADFAQVHGCNDLYNKARSFVYENFTQVSQNEEFLQLSPTQLVQVVKRDELNVRCESEVYEAVVRWVSHDPSKRCRKLEQLMGVVRCHFLTPCYLKRQVVNCPILKKNPKCKDYLAKVCQDLMQHRKCTQKKRRPNAPPVIYTIGGYLRHSLSHVECYNPQSNEWHKLASLPKPRSGVASCTIHSLIFVLGGRNNSPEGNQDIADVDSYDPYANMWTRCKFMSVPRNRVSCGVLDGQIYAVGGSHGQQHHNTVEKYDPTTDSWSEVAPMASARIGVGVAVVNRLLYAVGGFDGTDRLRSVECYHPENDEWCYVAPMSTTRSGAGVCALEQYVYVVGGYNSVEQLPSVERYDTETNQWETVAQMMRPRSALSVAVVNTKLYALGGYDGNDFLSSVECYDQDKNEWSEVTKMMCGRSGHGVAVAMEPCLKYVNERGEETGES